MHLVVRKKNSWAKKFSGFTASISPIVLKPNFRCIRNFSVFVFWTYMTRGHLNLNYTILHYRFCSPKKIFLPSFFCRTWSMKKFDSDITSTATVQFYSGFWIQNHQLVWLCIACCLCCNFPENTFQFLGFVCNKFCFLMLLLSFI